MFPKWKYHKSEPAKVVENEAEEKELGPGWHEAPVEAEAVEDIQSEPATEVDQPEVPAPVGAAMKIESRKSKKEKSK